MGGVKWLVVLLVAAGPAWAQSEEEITAATGKQLDVFSGCIKAEAAKQAKASTLPAETIADKAIAACGDERDGLLEQLQKPPIAWTDEHSKAEVIAALQQLRPQILETIAKSRSE